MKRTVVLILLAFFFLSAYGCSFVMKEYDDAQERKVTSLEQQNRDLVKQVDSLNRQVSGLGQEVETLKQKVVDLDTQKSQLQDEKRTLESQAGAAEPAEPVETITEKETKVMPAPEPPARAPASEETPAEKRMQELIAKDRPDLAARLGEPKGPAKPPSPSKPAVAKPQKAEPSAVKPAGKPEETAKKEKTPSKAQAKMEELLRARGMAVPSQRLKAQPPQEAPKAPAETAAATPEETVADKVTEMKKDTVLKVLSGTGDIGDAEGLASDLRKLGYKTDKVGKAQRSNYEESVVYYDKDHKDLAEALSKELGHGTVIQPLTWESTFKVIVVAGKKLKE